MGVSSIQAANFAVFIEAIRELKKDLGEKMDEMKEEIRQDIELMRKKRSNEMVIKEEVEVKEEVEIEKVHRQDEEVVQEKEDEGILVENRVEVGSYFIAGTGREPELKVKLYCVNYRKFEIEDENRDLNYIIAKSFVDNKIYCRGRNLQANLFEIKYVKGSNSLKRNNNVCVDVLSRKGIGGKEIGTNYEILDNQIRENYFQDFWRNFYYDRVVGDVELELSIENEGNLCSFEQDEDCRKQDKIKRVRSSEFLEVVGIDYLNNLIMSEKGKRIVVIEELRDYVMCGIFIEKPWINLEKGGGKEKREWKKFRKKIRNDRDGSQAYLVDSTVRQFDF
ncbi:uncharacterized protein LOC116171081 [Photinus pyralis]|uniref:uncharacterized protein LOC116171081 n=1 Tax=Photinus pyralis TaxID=7054 RepID=UPI001266E5CF|nr:uncharacterized protein LOC116171081 [Photinus pyralis]